MLVGVGAITQHGDDPAELLDAADLLAEAAARAEADAGAPGLLRRVQLVAVPNGTWAHPDPGREVVQRYGATARSLIAEIGITQQAVVARACEVLQRGEADVVLVGGTEAKHRHRVLAKAGIDPPPPLPGAPDEWWAPEAEIISRAEIERQLAVPAHQYAIVERVLGTSVADLGRLWERFALVASGNPDAWDRSAPSAAAITTPSAANRMIAEPYTRLCCSQWNVDMAVALVLATAEAAEASGVAMDRWVFPVSSAGSDLMVPLPRRAELAQWPAFRLAAGAALRTAGIGLDDVAVLDLYSCFPAAVQVQARELGLGLFDRPLTVTGGMTFAGGPLNSSALHSLATVARRLREEPGAIALVTSVSGMLTKPGVGVWSGAPTRQLFRSVDVTAAAAAGTATKPFAPDGTGAGTVAGATVLHGPAGPTAAVAIVELTDGSRTVAAGPPGAPLDVGAAVRVGPAGAYDRAGG